MGHRGYRSSHSRQHNLGRSINTMKPEDNRAATAIAILMMVLMAAAFWIAVTHL